MGRILRKIISSSIAASAMLAAALAPAAAAPKKSFDIAWTIYVGWMPWPYAADSGIVKKWADK
jgi:NitT/TauT family transport system substrate-binding protein